MKKFIFCIAIFVLGMADTIEAQNFGIYFNAGPRGNQGRCLPSPGWRYESQPIRSRWPWTRSYYDYGRQVMVDCWWENVPARDRFGRVMYDSWGNVMYTRIRVCEPYGYGPYLTTSP